MWKAVKMDTFKPLPNDKVLSRPFYDLFGDETILLVETPGHSKGLTSTVVKNTSGDFVLLGADVGYAGDSASQLRIPSILSSKQHAVESLAWAKEMSNTPDCKGLLFNHDSQIKQQKIIL